MKKEYWINMAKFVAILAVLVDHTYGVLYTNRSVFTASWFSVPLFILLMGITSYWSYERNFGRLKGKVVKQIVRVAAPYLVATAVYLLFAFRTFDLQTFLTAAVHFNASGPFYFILLYTQLLLVGPLMFYGMKICRKKFCGYKARLLLMYTIYGGGGNLIKLLHH